MDAATHGLIDDARDLREKALYSPAMSRYKIYIIDEAHQLSTGAGNALLKLVEEPPPHLRFIFATTEPEKIIGTIRSRTHHYAFRLVPAKILQTHLASICKSEKFKADPAALALIARASGGSVRDSLSILGQLLAGSGPDGLTYDDAAAQLGVTDSALIDKVIAALARRDGAELFKLIDQVVDAGHDPRRFVTDLLERLRDLLIVSQVPDATVSGLIDGPPELVGELVEQAAGFGPGQLTRSAEVVSNGLSELKGATAPRLQLELLMARLILPAADIGPDALVARVEQLERQLASGVQVAQPAVPTLDESAAPTKAPAKAPEAKTAASKSGSAAATSAPPPRLSDIAPSATLQAGPANTGTPEPPAEVATESAPETDQQPKPGAAQKKAPAGTAVTLDQARALWPAFLDEVKAGSRVSWTMVMASQPLSVSGDVVVAAHADKGAVTRFSKSASNGQLSEALSTVLGSPVKLELVHDPGGAQPKSHTKAGGQNEPTADVARSQGKANSSANSKSSSRDKAAAPPQKKPASDDEVDVSESEDVDEVSGIELVQRELGATKITEYDGV